MPACSHETQATYERALTTEEREAIVKTAHTERLAYYSVREIYAKLLDEKTYLGSISTMYRVHLDTGDTKERQRLATLPAANPSLQQTRLIKCGRGTSPN